MLSTKIWLLLVTMTLWPAPTLAVQAILATIIELEIHWFIQETDKVPLQDMDNEAKHAPLLLITLDLSHWTAIMIAFIADTEKGLGCLREAQQALGQLSEKDEFDFEETV